MRIKKYIYNLTLSVPILNASGTLFLLLSPVRDLRVFCLFPRLSSRKSLIPVQDKTLYYRYLTFPVPTNSGKVRYPNEKVPSAYITRRPERESAILVDPPRAKVFGHQLRNIPPDFVSWISSAIFPWRERYRQIAPSPARVDVLYTTLRV